MGEGHTSIHSEHNQLILYPDFEAEYSYTIQAVLWVVKYFLAKVGDLLSSPGKGIWNTRIFCLFSTICSDLLKEKHLNYPNPLKINHALQYTAIDISFRATLGRFEAAYNDTEFEIEEGAREVRWGDETDRLHPAWPSKEIMTQDEYALCKGQLVSRKGSQNSVSHFSTLFIVSDERTGLR